MLSLDEAKARWSKTTKASSLDDLRKHVREDDDATNPCTAGLRSICWKIFLHFQSTDIHSWIQSLADSRSAYGALRAHFLKYIEHPEELGANVDPLNDDPSSPWNALRLDEEMRAEIFQDVERCMPDEPFFRQPHIQRTLLDILFIFCKLNQDVGYRQGMHELLAPILWVIEHDSVDFSSSSSSSASSPSRGKGNDQVQQSEDFSLGFRECLDSQYVEADAFTLFTILMQFAKSFYELGEPERRASISGTTSVAQNASSPIVERSRQIHEVYLAQLDPELANHLTRIEVLPQIFLIRWIRLLFGREFPFDSLLALWDTLFAEDPTLALVDLICVSMLLRIRWQLIEAPYSQALTLLLKYPQPLSPSTPKTFVEDALYIRTNPTILGGSTLITKYTNRAPSSTLSPTLATFQSHSHEPSRASSPFGRASTHIRGKSSLGSPSRFQSGVSVEALLQGAAKNVMERGERLGINQAVRDAVGEMKKNMAARPNRLSPKRVLAIQSGRWSLDEGRVIVSPSGAPSARSWPEMAALEQRNGQLAKMLESAMEELRSAAPGDGGKADEDTPGKEKDGRRVMKAIDSAVAKVQFVKVYLEDSTLPLPPAHPPSPAKEIISTISPVAPKSPIADHPAPKIVAQIHTPEPTTVLTKETSTPSPEAVSVRSAGGGRDATAAAESATAALCRAAAGTSSGTSDVDGASDIFNSTQTSQAVSTTSHALRPQALVPRRSSLAQSSFSWMLEPDQGTSSSPPKTSVSFLKAAPKEKRMDEKSKHRANREKAAFLFGEEDEGEGEMGNSGIKYRRGEQEGSEVEEFNLGDMGGKGKEKAGDGEMREEKGNE